MNVIKLPVVFMDPTIRACRDAGHDWTPWRPAIVTPRSTTEARYCIGCLSSQTRYQPGEAA